MISGTRALAEIERAVAQARGSEAQLDQALVSALNEVKRLRQQRADAFRELARVKLDAMRRKDMIGELDAAERRAIELVEQQEQALGQLIVHRQAVETAVGQLQTARQARAEALEQAVAALEAQRVRIEQEAQASADWQARKAAVTQALATAEAALSKAAQAEADREEKRKPYEADPLFMYLWRRKFGTADYGSGGLVRLLDRWVAGLIGFIGARANYAMLNEIPARLRAHAERLKADAEAARAALAAFERERLVAGGAVALEAKAAEAKAALDAAEAKLAAQREEMARLDEAHAKAVASRNALPEEAVSLLAEADAQQDLRELYREAQRTATPADEAILRQIEATDHALLRTEQQVRAARDQILAAAQRRTELERVRGDFRRRGYDGPWGGFQDNGRLQDTLGRVLTGALGGAVLGGILQDSWRPRQTPFDPDFGGGAGLPWPMPGDGGGGWGGGGGESAPDMGGGDDGFSTGGSF